jgi:hypothetical protein
MILHPLGRVVTSLARWEEWSRPLHAITSVSASMHYYEFSFVEYQTGKLSDRRIFEFLEQLVNGLPIDSRGSDVDAVFEMTPFRGNFELLNRFRNDENEFVASHLDNL